MTLLRNLSVRFKIIVLLFIAILALASIWIVNYNTMNKMNENTVSMYQEQLLPVQWIESIRADNTQIFSDILEMIISDDPGVDGRMDIDISARTKEIQKLLDQYGKVNLDSYEKNNLESLNISWQQYMHVHARTIAIAEQLGKQNEAYDAYTTDLFPVRQQLDDILHKLSVHTEQVANQINQQNQQSFLHTKFVSIVIFAVAIFICAFIGMLIDGTIRKPIIQIQTVMKQAEAGDLTVQGNYRSKDEIGQLMRSFNSMITGLQVLIRQVRDNAISLAATAEQLQASSEHTSKASEQIAVSIQEMSAGTEIQVHSVDETVQTVEQMSASVQQIAASSQEVSTKASNALNTANQGSQAIHKTIQQMNSIHATVDQSAQTIRELGEQAHHIGTIVETISGIAAQTNLLALNAAIEAARAGEHGRGFSVVADEVRKLAEESSKSAKQISDYITSIHQKIGSVVKSMEQGTREVTTGIDVVQVAGQSFQNIQTAVQDVATQIKDVSASVQQMAAGAEQVVKAIASISTTADRSLSGVKIVSTATEEQLASMQEITASAHSLSMMADELEQLVKTFNV
ncbi:methyl-accepting chemotaxis protein [Fodinisporobacter ferrooxydans]|uniref:Methyl-accepting chemotaxis protein n=1 Tax=Fodinisporobacter ferrooxydans TaxID=2901836 RepID=A0ABY4CLM9_9BACL|nr:methyl-accepting chemotaxis protein [Alicyclobacillaceae bacterium MYW30-H2]